MSDSETELEDINHQYRIRKVNLENRPQVSNVNIAENVLNENNLEMAQAGRNENGMNYQLLRLYVDTIPPYDGNPHTLSIFINNCTSLINNFFREGDDPHNSFIVRAIIGKLSGRALSLIGSRLYELDTWNNIKTALELSFGDQRNLDCLVQDLIALSPSKNETPYNFGMRCQDARSLIFSKINSLGLPDEERRVRVQNYDELALKTFVRGLSGQLQNNVRLRDPRNLEIAMALVIEEENFLYSQQRGNTLNTQIFRPNQRITPLNPHFNVTKPSINYQNNLPSNFGQQTFGSIPRPTFNNFARPAFSNFQARPNSNFQARPMFQQQNLFRPNNFQPQRPPHHFQRPSQIIRNQPFNNQNRFGYNNFQNQRFPQQHRLDEPMDTSSGPSIKRQPFNNPNPKYTVTELHHQTVEPENVNKGQGSYSHISDNNNTYYLNTENDPYSNPEPYPLLQDSQYSYDIESYGIENACEPGPGDLPTQYPLISDDINNYASQNASYNPDENFTLSTSRDKIP